MDINQNEKNKSNEKKLGYYTLDPEMNLLNINFATGENQFLNEHQETVHEIEKDENYEV